MAGKTVRIPVDDCVRGIRAGWDDEALTKKYGLSALQLQRLFEKLVKGGFIEQSELDVRADSVERKREEKGEITIEPDEEPEPKSRQGKVELRDPLFMLQDLVDKMAVRLNALLGSRKGENAAGDAAAKAVVKPSFDLTSMSVWSTVILPAVSLTAALIVGAFLFERTWSIIVVWNPFLLMFSDMLILTITGPIRRYFAIYVVLRLRGVQNVFPNNVPQQFFAGLNRILVIGTEAVLFYLIALPLVVGSPWTAIFVVFRAAGRVLFPLFMYYVTYLILSFLENQKTIGAQ